jgi:threonylcarbamoyladenosine tRNA methylthiotransferase MtaB
MRRRLAGICDIVDFGREADVYVVNTCTVTSGSDSQARQLIRGTARRHPGAKIVVTGCYAQRAEDELLAIDGVASVFGNGGKETLLDLIGELIRPAAAGASTGAARLSSSGHERSRAQVAVQRGCDRRCSYCIVPSVRGRARSVPLKQIRQEVETLLDEGYREIVLTGTYLGDYGADLGRADLPGLLRALGELVDGKARLRISSLGPRDFTPGLVGAVEECGCICRHFHIAFQSGDDSILRSMNRGYDSLELRRSLDFVVERFPDCGLGCDVMVGFPGEDEPAFANTRRILEDYPFSYSHVFVFSPRPGTAAEKLDGQVDPRVAAQRSLRLRRMSTEKGISYARRFVGRRIEVIAEGVSSEDGLLTGTSEEYLRAFFEGDAEWKGRILPIDVDGVRAARQVRGTARAH